MLKKLIATLLLSAVLALAGCTGASSSASGASGASGESGAASASGASAASGESGAADASGVASDSRAAGQAVLKDCPISYNDDFGNVYINVSIDDFNALGFAYGDEVHIEFSNGYEISVPYLSGYYGKVGDRMLVAYPGSERIILAENFGDPMWEQTGVTESDTATVTLTGPARFIDIQNSFNIAYSDDRAEYDSDVAFANFRSMSGGNLKPDTVYRSASPVDDKHNRAAYVGELMAQAGVRFVLNLADDDAEMDESQAEAREKGVDESYFVALREEGNVVGINLGANYPAASYAQKLAGGFVALSQHDGPYLLHCTEGKDRTGFACMILEALAGATYDEMLADYMITYDNYYGINRESDPTRFETIARTNFDSMLEHLPGMEGVELATASYEEPARAYLRMGDMTDEQIDALIAHIV